MFFWILEREEGGKQERQWYIDVRKKHRWPPAHALTRDQTCSPLVHTTVLQSTESPGQDSLNF